MIYELREYVAAPGAVDRLHARFADHTLDLFARHAITVSGFWTDAAEPDRIVYLVSFPDEDAQRAAWAAFGADPDWQRVKTESEKDGPIVAEMHSRNLLAAPYGPTAVGAR